MNVGLIGKGYWGSIVESKLKNICNLKFVADSKTDYTSKLNDVDWIFVCSPTNTHYDIVKKCLYSNKNVFCEKPFTGNYKKAKELIEVAKNKNLKLFIDNIFLYREETKKLTNTFKDISFIWNKSEKINQNIYDSLLYHDVYLLINTTKFENWNVVEKNINDCKLKVVLQHNQKTAFFYYDRSLSFKQKIIKLDDLEIDYSVPTTDPLMDIINQLNKNFIDYSANQDLTLKTLKLLTKIKNYD